MSTSLTMRDLTNTVRRVPLSWRIALQDVAERYERSGLGPIWMVMNLLVIISAMGILYSKIMRVPTNEYIPFLTCTMFVWQFIQNTLGEASATFVIAAGVIKNTAQPVLSHVVRGVLRNVIVSAHGVVVVVGCLAYYGVIGNVHVLSLLAGLPLLIINIFWLTGILAILGARYRDVQYMVGYVLQFLMFVSPIFWMPQMLQEHRYLAEFNPIYHWLAVVREPLLGRPTPVFSLGFSVVSAVIGVLVLIVVHSRTRTRIPFWI